MNGTLQEFKVHQLEKLARNRHSGETNMKGSTGLFLRNSLKNKTKQKTAESVRISPLEQSGFQYITGENKQTALLLEQHRHYSVPGRFIGS